jgi:uncharacterized protein YbaR (Trm112 family)
MSGTRMKLACPHCHGTNLRLECMQPVLYDVTYFQEPDGHRGYRCADTYPIVADWVESREILCDDCNRTLTQPELVPLETAAG